MRCFFIDKNALQDNCANITGKEARHLATVLRLQSGEKVKLFDGLGTVYLAELTQVSSSNIKALIFEKYTENNLHEPRLFFAPGLLKGKKMDFLVQKATELGVHEFWPLQTRYTELKGSYQRQQERWQRIMLEACKQCNRPIPMKIEPIKPFSHLAESTCSTKLLLWEGEKEVTFSGAINSKCDSLCLVIGPEGGFHSDEISLATQVGFKTITFGRRILRAETAAISALSISQFLLGGFQSENF